MHDTVILYSSFNNYDMLDGEVCKRVNFENRMVINVDDHSSEEQQKKGKDICFRNNIIYLSNKGKGVQSAIKTTILYLQDNGYEYKWLICLQQDAFPMGNNFFSVFEKNIRNYNLKNISAIGFNNLDDGHSTINTYSEFLKGNNPRAWMGIFFLSDSKNDKNRMSWLELTLIYLLSVIPNNTLKEKIRLLRLSKRWFSERFFYNFNAIAKKYTGIFSIELPAWTSIAINIDDWNKFIEVDKKYIFHLWFPDIAMQFLSKNRNIAVMSDLYIHNDQKIKEKYGFNKCSADAGKNSENIHVEDYGNHLDVFYDKWQFSYEDPKNTLPKIIRRYENTLVERYFQHDCRNGPLEVYLKKSS